MNSGTENHYIQNCGQDYSDYSEQDQLTQTQNNECTVNPMEEFDDENLIDEQEQYEQQTQQQTQQDQQQEQQQEQQQAIKFGLCEENELQTSDQDSIDSMIDGTDNNGLQQCDSDQGGIVRRRKVTSFEKYNAAAGSSEELLATVDQIEDLGISALLGENTRYDKDGNQFTVHYVLTFSEDKVYVAEETILKTSSAGILKHSQSYMQKQKKQKQHDENKHQSKKSKNKMAVRSTRTRSGRRATRLNHQYYDQEDDSQNEDYKQAQSDSNSYGSQDQDVDQKTHSIQTNTQKNRLRSPLKSSEMTKYQKGMQKRFKRMDGHHKVNVSSYCDDEDAQRKRDMKHNQKVSIRQGNFELNMPLRVRSINSMKQKLNPETIIAKVEWHKDKDGFQPAPSIHSYQEVRKQAPKLLCDYYQRHLQLVD